MNNLKTKNGRLIKGGYIALGIISTISLAMLLISVDMGRQSIMMRENVGHYENARIAETLYLSCISIAREKIAMGMTGAIGGFSDDEIIWQLRGGECEIEKIDETQNYLKIRIENNIETEIEKGTGRVLSLRRY